MGPFGGHVILIYVKLIYYAILSTGHHVSRLCLPFGFLQLKKKKTASAMADNTTNLPCVSATIVNYGRTRGLHAGTIDNP